MSSRRLTRWLKAHQETIAGGTLILFLGATIIFAFIISPLVTLVRYTVHPDEFRHDPGLIILTVLIFALLAGIIKRSRWRILYGSLEIVTACVWIFYALSSQLYQLKTSPSERLVQIAGFLYLVRRGVDNVLDGSTTWQEWESEVFGFNKKK
jgi:hypothetical protein